MDVSTYFTDLRERVYRVINPAYGTRKRQEEAIELLESKRGREMCLSDIYAELGITREGWRSD